MATEKYTQTVRRLIGVSRMHKALVDKSVSDMEIHQTQHRILMRLAFSGNLPSQKELAEHLGLTPAAVTVALKKIENEGYIKRTLGKDNRYNEIKITEKGKAVVSETKERFDLIDVAMFSGLSEEELSRFIESLDKIFENLKSLSQNKEKISTEN